MKYLLILIIVGLTSCIHIHEAERKPNDTIIITDTIHRVIIEEISKKEILDEPIKVEPKIINKKFEVIRSKEPKINYGDTYSGYPRVRAEEPYKR